MFIQKQKYQQQKLFILNYMLVENLVEIVDIKYLEDFMVLVHLLLMHCQNGQKLQFKEMAEFTK